MDYTYKGTTYYNYLGNYWGSYDGSDFNNDGVGDTKFNINGDNDTSPLMQSSDNYLEEMELIKFRGNALNYFGEPEAGAPYGWTVKLTYLMSGPQPCSEQVNVTLQAVSPPKGYMDDNITVGVWSYNFLYLFGLLKVRSISPLIR